MKTNNKGKSVELDLRNAFFNISLDNEDIMFSFVAYIYMLAAIVRPCVTNETQTTETETTRQQNDPNLTKVL